ncbi:hypothetical protein LguiB_003204 [Lonicera macranthoides]
MERGDGSYQNQPQPQPKIKLQVDLLDVSINGPKEKLESTVQITAVTESFEHSLIRVMRAYHLPALRELRGYISHHALNLILREIKRSYKVGIDKNTCRCILRVTYGLPCAHEIADFSRQNRAILLLSCDSHWSKLSIVPTAENHNELDGSLEIKRLIKRFQECNDEQCRILIKKIRELANPETTWLNEPLAAAVSKGRPRKLAKRQRAATYSTKRDYSGFEYAKTIEDLESIQNKTLNKQPKRKKPALTDLNEDELINHLQPVHKKILKKQSKQTKSGLIDLNDKGLINHVLALFNPNIKEHVILALEDVAPDGHCGFRACAELLGKNKEDGWKEVRTAMLTELREYKELYTSIGW